MDIRVTPLSVSRLASGPKGQTGSPAVYQQKLGSLLKTDRKTGQGDTNQDALVTNHNRLNKPQTFNSSKRLAGNNTLLLAKKGIASPRVFLKITPGIEQAAIVPGNKKVLLYQQIEENKLLSNNSELVNRFNYKV